MPFRRSKNFIHFFFSGEAIRIEIKVFFAACDSKVILHTNAQPQKKKMKIVKIFYDVVVEFAAYTKTCSKDH